MTERIFSKVDKWVNHLTNTQCITFIWEWATDYERRVHLAVMNTMEKQSDASISINHPWISWRPVPQKRVHSKWKDKYVIENCITKMQKDNVWQFSIFISITCFNYSHNFYLCKEMNGRWCLFFAFVLNLSSVSSSTHLQQYARILWTCINKAFESWLHLTALTKPILQRDTIHAPMTLFH